MISIIASCILSPLYMQVRNDVTVMYTLIPILLEYAIILFESVYIALLCSVAVYSVYGVMKGTESKSTSIILMVTVAFLKHALNLAVSSIIDGYIDLSFDIPATVMQFLADILLLFIVALVARSKWKIHFDHAEKIQKASKYISTVEYNEFDEIFPFGGLFNLKNYVIFPIFVGSAITLAILIVQRLGADLALGLPTTWLEVIEIILSYISDILLALIGYIAAYFAASFIFLKAISETSKN
ncbi:MAG: hypothetical protein ACI3XI_04080 [Eubacteriales bacterium]